MAGKRVIISLIAALVAFGYLFTLNPQSTDFQLVPGTSFNTSFALICVLFFITGFGVALFGAAFTQAWHNLKFWKHKKDGEKVAQADKLTDMGRNLTVRGNPRAARRLLRKASRIDPHKTRISLELARAEIEDSKHDQARQRLDRLSAIDPRNPEVLALRLKLYGKLDDFEGQVVALNKRLELDPEHMESLTLLRDLYENAGHNGEAARIQERVVNATSNRAERAAQRGRLTRLRLAHAIAQPAPTAIKTLQKLSEKESYAPAYAELGEAHARNGEGQRAEQAWLSGFKATSRPGLLWLLEKYKVERGQPDEMLSTYKKLTRKHPVVALLRARLLISLSRFEEAVEVLEKAATNISGSALGSLLMGEAQYKLQRFEKAALAMRQGAGALGRSAFLTFTCRQCGKATGNWTRQCPDCGAEDTLELDPTAPAPLAPAAKR